MIYCLMTSGVPLSDFARSALFKTALRMAKQKKRICKIIHDDVEGEVVAQWKACCFGSIAGTAFEAQVVTPKGVTKVKYLVRDSDLTDEDIDKGHWTKAKVKTTMIAPPNVKALHRTKPSNN